MNENQIMDTPKKNRKAPRWRTQDENMLWITTKENNGPNFQHTTFWVIELVLADSENKGYTSQFSPRVWIIITLLN